MPGPVKRFTLVVGLILLVALGAFLGVSSGSAYRSWQNHKTEAARVEESNEYLRESLQGIAIGKPFPDIPLWSPDGRSTVTIGNLLPDGGVVYYIVLGCESCLDAVSSLEKVTSQREVSEARIVVIASGIPDEAQEFIRASGFGGRLFLDATNSLSVEYGVRSFPAYFCLDRDQSVLSFGAEVRTLSQLSEIVDNCTKDEDGTR